MRVSVPHQLSRDDARARLKARTDQIAGLVPGGMARVEADWVDDDHLALAISAMGQPLSGGIEILDHEVTITIDLPAMLGFAEPMIAAAIRETGPKLLA